MLTLRQILKRYEIGAQLSKSDSIVVAEFVLASPAFSDTVKSKVESGWYMIKPVGHRRVRMLHLCYAKGEDVGAIPLPLGKLEQKLKARASRAKSSSERNKVLAACRAIIQPQIGLFRDEFWAEHFAKVQLAVERGDEAPKYPRCPLSGKSLWSNKAHVDHVYPFVRMVEDWLAESELKPEQIQCVNSRKLKRMTMGPTLDQSWYDYHAAKAELRLVEARANMSKGAKVGVH